MTVKQYVAAGCDFKDLTVEQRKDFLLGWQSAAMGTECRQSAADVAFFEQGRLEAVEHAAAMAAKKPKEEEPKE